MNELVKDDGGKNGARLVASYLFSLSLFALAGSIAYFTYEMTNVSKQVPDILQSIDNTSEKIEPIINEVGQIIDLVPPILKQVEETRKLIPPILKEVEQTRQQIPALLKESEAIREESEAIRGELPAVLASADKASAAVVDVAKQVEATRPLIPEVLKEVETTRESIPPMMDRADVLIEKARVAGQEASEGAVTGLFTGIIRAPFALVGDAGRSITGLTETEAKQLDKKDFELVEKASLYLLNNGTKGEERQWENADSGNHGVIVLTDIYTEGEYAEIDCRSLDVQLYKKDKMIKQTPRSFCKDSAGKWDLDK